MAFALPNGSTIKVQSTAAVAVVAFTQITNAAHAEVTMAGTHTLKAGDIVLIKSGWTKLDNIVAKVKAVTTNVVTLGNIKTTNTDIFPAGDGVGSLIKIPTFEQIPQIKEVSSDGGDQNYIQIQFLEDDKERSLPTIKSAKTQTFTMAHDSSLPVYETLKNHDMTGDIVVLSMYVPKAKETRYWAAKVSFDPTPVTAINELETVKISTTVESPAITFYKD